MTPELLRELAWYAPAVGSAGLIMLSDRRPRTLGAVLLSVIWTGWTLAILQHLAPQMGWWGPGTAVERIPDEMLVGWVLLWGPIPLLGLSRVPLVGVLVLMGALDLVLMPLFDPLVHLEPSWLQGEAVALVLCLLPAQWLARRTLADTALPGRVALHLLWFIPVAVVGIPAVLAPEADWRSLLAYGAMPLQLGLAALLWGLSAVLEFAERGGGTPLPFDPPKRLVASGPYRYVANPMQLALGAWFAGLALWWMEPWLVVAVLVTIGFGEVPAAVNEAADLRAREGDAWERYRREVRRWRPRWTPYAPTEARVYIAQDCGPCREMGDWLFARAPVGLKRVPAAHHPDRAIRRITYDPGDGTPEVEGVLALARCLEHIHLGWAWFSFALRVPGAVWLLQVLVDAVGGGPRDVHWVRANEAPAPPPHDPG